MKIPTDETKVFAFEGWDIRRAKFVVNKVIGKILNFIYLGFDVRSNKIRNCPERVYLHFIM